MCVICLQDNRLCASFSVYLLDPGTERDATQFGKIPGRLHTFLLMLSSCYLVHF